MLLVSSGSIIMQVLLTRRRSLPTELGLQPLVQGPENISTHGRWTTRLITRAKAD